eukprot:sb/3476881/
MGREVFWRGRRGYRSVCGLASRTSGAAYCTLIYTNRIRICITCVGEFQEPTETSKQPIRTRYLGHVTGYQPIRDQYSLILSVTFRDILETVVGVICGYLAPECLDRLLTVLVT